MTIRVVVVDDQALVRGGFAMVLDHQPDIEVVAEAGNGVEAVAVVHQHRPDVVLMDIRMPEMDGLQATARIWSPSATAVGTPATVGHTDPVILLRVLGR